MITVRNLEKRYFIDTPNEIKVLDDINLEIEDGEFVALIGASGSGKSTFMNIIGALDTPTSGEYTLDGEMVHKMTQNELSDIRSKKIGFVFQSFNLIGRSNSLKNVELPMLYAGIPAHERKMRAKELLELVGMSDRMHHLPNQLSGGQKQRVAIARALVNNPSIILADEPTGALDSVTGSMVMDIFLKVNKEQKKTILLVTHSPELAQMTQRIITIKDGRILSDTGKHKDQGEFNKMGHVNGMEGEMTCSI
jgi:putative ABC transport system ATP-binding protein